MSAAHERLQALGRSVREALPQDSAVERQVQREAVQRLATRPQPETKWLAPSLVAGTLAAAAIAAVVLWPGQGSSPAEASPAVPVALAQYSNPERTEQSLSLDPATVAVAVAPPAVPSELVSDQDPQPVLLKDGSVEVKLGAPKRILAGPYEVIVEQGACLVAWNAERAALRIDVREGQIVLHGPTSKHTVVAGDSVRATLQEVVVSRFVKDVPGKSVRRAKSPSLGSARIGVLLAWQRLANEGKYKAAWAQVREQGILAHLGSLSRSELRTLATVTRLGGAAKQSVVVLETQRKRFAGTREAKRAAFLLGRQAEREHQSKRAVQWYREYLAASASGPLAEEARGRLMTVLAERGQRAQAKAVATRYLGDHPNGIYAERARRLVAPN